jgi:hypothetical protein
MVVRNYWAFLSVLGFTLFLTGCGDLGMVLPSQGSYQVNAQVLDKDDTDSSYTLDTYSVVKSSSKIRPYFVNSVAGDPDVQGLMVFVQDYSGNIVSRRVHYLLDGKAEKPMGVTELPPELPAKTQQETPAGTESGKEEGPIGSTDEVSPADPPEKGALISGGTETAVSEGSETGNAEADEPEFPMKTPTEAPGLNPPQANAATNFPAAIPGKTDAGETETRVAADTGATPVEAAAKPASASEPKPESATQPESAPKSEPATKPEPAPKPEPATKPAPAAEIEPVTKTVDAGNAAGAGGTTADTPTALVAPSADTAKPDPKSPSTGDETVLVKQLDQNFEPFQIEEELAIGRYNLVFQVLGKNKVQGEWEILYKTFKSIYFIGDAAFTLGDIQSFLPMTVTGGRLIPPGINVMLETAISADPRLDPYIIWYNGKTILAQGRASGGANHLLWKTPERTGFHSIRAEAFPLLPEDRVPENIIGKIKELSLPVSSKSTGMQRFEHTSGEFINWYQLRGTLDDAKALNNPERKLISLHSQPPRWTPFGGMYGLLVGPDDIYALPGTPFKLSRDEQGTGRIFLHLAALSGGAILNIRFAGGEIPRQASGQADTAGTAEMDLSFAGGALIQRIASEGESKEESLELNSDEPNGFITIIIEFVIKPDQFDTKLILTSSDGERETDLLSINLARPISGEAAIRLGGGAAPPVSGETGKHDNGTVALNEMALSYIRSSIPKEEKVESGLQESLFLNEENPDTEPEPPFLSAL